MRVRGVLVSLEFATVLNRSTVCAARRPSLGTGNAAPVYGANPLITHCIIAQTAAAQLTVRLAFISGTSRRLHSTLARTHNRARGSAPRKLFPLWQGGGTDRSEQQLKHRLTLARSNGAASRWPPNTVTEVHMCVCLCNNSISNANCIDSRLPGYDLVSPALLERVMQISLMH